MYFFSGHNNLIDYENECGDLHYSDVLLLLDLQLIPILAQTQQHWNPT